MTNEFFEKVKFLKMFLASKQDIRKSWDAHSVLQK